MENEEKSFTYKRHTKTTDHIISLFYIWVISLPFSVLCFMSLYLRNDSLTGPMFILAETGYFLSYLFLAPIHLVYKFSGFNILQTIPVKYLFPLNSMLVSVLIYGIKLSIAKFNQPKKSDSK